jgi:hypothetical protein
MFPFQPLTVSPSYPTVSKQWVDTDAKSTQGISVTYLELRLHADLPLPFGLLLQLLYLVITLGVAPRILREVVRGQLAILALDSQFLGDLTNSVEGPAMALGGNLGATLSMFFLNLSKAIVEIIVQMTTGA